MTVGTDHLGDRDEQEARQLAQEIRDGLDVALELEHDRAADQLRDRMLRSAHRKLRSAR